MINSNDCIDVFGQKMSNKTLMRLLKLNKISNAGFAHFCA